ncbi:hypothetical protein ACH3XW_41580 [Acanthocheilonema viteae]
MNKLLAHFNTLIPRSRSAVLLVTDYTNDYLINEDSDPKASIRIKRFRPLMDCYENDEYHLSSSVIMRIFGVRKDIITWYYMEKLLLLFMH